MALLDENDAEMLAPDFSDDEQGKKKRVRRKRSKKVVSKIIISYCDKE